MRRGAFGAVSWVGAVALWLASCGDSEDAGNTHAQAGGGGQGAEGGENGEAGAPRTGGVGGGATGGSINDPGGTGPGGAPEGGTGGSGGRTPGSLGGTSGMGTGMGGEGGDGPGGGGAAGAGDEHSVCDRLSRTEAELGANDVRRTFERRYYADCRVAWFSTLYLPPIDERAEFGQKLIELSLMLWGCLDTEPTSFDLIHTPVPLSPAEARALIDHYLASCRVEVALSPAEATPIERKLEALAAPLIDETLEDFSRSRCPDAGTGGQSGAGGMGDGGTLAQN